eukprot:4325-Prymnesium_polylepis.1
MCAPAHNSFLVPSSSSGTVPRPVRSIRAVVLVVLWVEGDATKYTPNTACQARVLTQSDRATPLRARTTYVG